ncbi:putative ribonuclease H-like domain-containing protein [Tanacetum coccineum]
MRPFGCPVIILNTIDHLEKFDGKADEGFFLGYSTNSKAFRVFNSRTRTVEENMHVQFSENTPNIAKSKDRVETIPGKDYILLPLWTQDPPFSSSLKDSPDDGLKPSGDNEKKVTEETGKEGGNPSEEVERVNQEKDANVNNTNNINTVSPNINAGGIEDNDVDDNIVYECADDLNMSELEEIIYSDDDEDVGAEVDMNNLDAFIPHLKQEEMTKSMNEHVMFSSVQQRTNHKDFQNCLFACFLSQEEPKKVVQALKDPSWIKAMQEELLQFKLQEVWTLVELPNVKRAIGTRWVFRNKKDERGIMIKNKARLVAQGYTQEEGIDYDEVFAPVARIEAIRLFLAYASYEDFVVYQMDVKSAFIYGKIEEEVYVSQSPGFEDPNFPDIVYKVEKALYGLQQAPRAWYETLSTYLLDSGFQRGKKDKTLFIRRGKGDILLVQVYVDDIIFGSTIKIFIKEGTLYHKERDVVFRLRGTLTYKKGLDYVEAQTCQYRKNEVLLSEEVVVLKTEVGCKQYEINMLKTEFKKVKQEKEGIDFKIEKFENASKDLDKLLGSQITDNSKKGLGYHAVPPPHPLIYNAPPKLDLSNSGLEEFQQPEFEGYGPKDSKNVSTGAPIIEDWESDSDDEKKPKSKVEKKTGVSKTVSPTVCKIKFVRPKQQEKPVRKPVKYAEIQVNTTRPKAVVSAGRTNQVNAVKASACWVWRPGKPETDLKDSVRRNYQEESFTHKKYMAPMAFSDSELYTDKTCSKTCLQNYETLKKQCDDLIVKLNQTEFTVATYRRGLATVEAQLITYRKNEVLFSQEVAVLKREVACKDYTINMLKSECEKVKQEKDGIEFKIKKFDKASKDLDQLLGSQITDKILMNSKSLNSKVMVLRITSKSLMMFVIKKSDNSKENSDDSLTEEQVSQNKSGVVKSSPNVDKETVFPVNKKVEFTKPENHEKLVKKSVREVNTARPKAVVNTVRLVNNAHPKIAVHTKRHYYTRRHNAVNTARSYTGQVTAVRGKPQHNDKGFVDSGCSRHMTGNIAYLSDFKEFDGAYVAFGGDAYGGKITGKGTLKTDNLDFEDAEAVSTACYVQNKVLVVKPHNKTPYENFRGFKQALSFMRPFGCHVTILNTLDSLDKFDGKSDEGTISNDSAGTSKEVSQDCIMMPIWKDTSYFDSPTKDVDYGEPKTADDAQKKVEEGLNNNNAEQERFADDSSTKDVNAAGQQVNTASPDVNTGSLKLNVVGPSVNIASPHEQDSTEEEPEVDLGNITNSYIVPTTPNTRIHKDHPIDNVIGEVKSTVQTRRMSKPTSE